jgi:hypothetical protein
MPDPQELLSKNQSHERSTRLGSPTGLSPLKPRLSGLNPAFTGKKGG